MRSSREAKPKSVIASSRTTMRTSRRTSGVPTGGRENAVVEETPSSKPTPPTSSTTFAGVTSASVPVSWTIT